MDGAMYMLSRRIKGDAGETFMQNVAVFAGSPTQARTLAEEQFARLRRVSTSPERAYQPTPAFRVEKIVLDRHKVITAGITR